MHPLRCPYGGNASAIRASKGVHNDEVVKKKLWN